MKIHVKFEGEGTAVDEDFEGASADAVLGQIKAKVVEQLPFALRAFAGAMSNVAFAQEVVRRANAANKTSAPLPKTAEEFIELGKENGSITVLEA
jgi:hypothetical protein